MSTLKVDTIQKADGTGSLSVPAESGSLVTTAAGSVESAMTTQFGRRNLIINGAMQVAQRGTSFTPSATQYCLDRFYSALAGGTSARFTMTQSTDAPTGFSSSLKWDCTTAEASLPAGGAIYDDYRIEGQDLQQLAYGTSDAKTVTLSFWVKSNKTGTYVVWFYTPDGTQHTGGTYTISSADTWEYKTITVSGHTSQTITNDNTVGLIVRFVYACGSNYTSGTQVTSWAADSNANRYAGQTVNIADSTSNYINLTGVQLEVGSVATPFEHRSYGEELALCQRYYQKTHFATGMHTSGTYVFLGLKFPEMRTAPSLSQPDGGFTINNVDYNTTQSSTHIDAFTIQPSSAFIGMDNYTGGVSYRPVLGRNTGNSITLDAEL